MLLVVLGDAVDDGLANPLILSIQQLGGSGVAPATNCGHQVNNTLVDVAGRLSCLCIHFPLGERVGAFNHKNSLPRPCPS